MTDQDTPADQSADEPLIPFHEFLESTPPNEPIRLSHINVTQPPGGGYELTLPEIRLHCPHEKCNGPRFFRCAPAKHIGFGHIVHFFFDFVCSNCRDFSTVFAISLTIKRVPHVDTLYHGQGYKFGQLPPFGPPTPSRLITMIGSDRETFLKGRRCENQGLGIGAFTYYRRVVERQKKRIIERIHKVADTFGADASVLATLDKAARETQFTRALDMAKPALPESLKINGHNPLGLLHSALSEGVHDLSDEQCLTLATDVRVVLAELSDRLAQALKDEAQLNEAVTRLLNRSQKSQED